MEQHAITKIILLGMGGVGKTSTTVQFVSGRFIEDYDPYYEGSYRKNIVIDNERFCLDILDTAMDDGETPNSENAIREYEGVILVYSVTSHESIDKISEYYSKVLNIKNTSNVPMILLGNKIDLENNRQVETNEGEAIAKAYNIPFFEISAKSNIKVEESFVQIIKEILKSRTSNYSNIPQK